MSQYALQKRWVPMEMAEIWIANPDVNLHATFTHGTIYESCDTCKSFLGFMVCGLDELLDPLRPRARDAAVSGVTSSPARR